MSSSNQNPLNQKYINAIEELKSHYQQLNKYLKSLQQQYITTMQQPQSATQKLPDPQQLQNHINQLINAYAQAAQKFMSVPQPPIIMSKDVLDGLLLRTKKNSEMINETVGRYDNLDKIQKRIYEQVNKTEQENSMNDKNNLNEMNQFNQMNNINTINEMNNQMNTINNMNEMNQINEMKVDGTTNETQKTAIDYLNEQDVDGLVNELLDWNNVAIIVNEQRTDDSIMLLSGALKKNTNDANKIEEICECFMAFLNMTQLSPMALSQMNDAVMEVIPSPAVSEEETPAILDVFQFIHAPKQ